ncbi:SET domain protein [Drechmeria coniospora]|uniref:SET domain protein n=1 Tax=Drechmeria coniospora TaxID=98403 RepID=A0A151GE70_DRECN|nr:SET domain protein [Drechmeria coniospora]KYK55385.1 SET domain protein [Drechmeria coniospora]
MNDCDSPTSYHQAVFRRLCFGRSWVTHPPQPGDHKLSVLVINDVGSSSLSNQHGGPANDSELHDNDFGSNRIEEGTRVVTSQHYPYRNPTSVCSDTSLSSTNLSDKPSDGPELQLPPCDRNCQLSLQFQNGGVPLSSSLRKTWECTRSENELVRSSKVGADLSGLDYVYGSLQATEPQLPPVVLKNSATPLFENDFIKVARSNIAGLGVFAAKTLKYGQSILRERPLFEADESCLFQNFGKLDPQARKVALSLYANELVKPGTPKIQAVWATNCFTVGGRQAGLFPIAARFNHACFPAQNVDFQFDPMLRCLVLTVCVPEIEAGQELRINYGKDRTPRELYITYGFRCQCGSCPGFDERDMSRLTTIW